MWLTAIGAAICSIGLVGSVVGLLLGRWRSSGLIALFWLNLLLALFDVPGASVWWSIPLLAIALYASASEVRRRRAQARNHEAAPLNEESDESRRFIESIPDWAEQHREKVEAQFGIRLDYDPSAFTALDEIINRAWPDHPPKTIDPIVIFFGSFVGETIRKLHGGTWAFNRKHGFHLQDVGQCATLFPFNKVRKRLLEGESLATYYQSVADVCRRRKP
jgi:hypothetical protein